MHDGPVRSDMAAVNICQRVARRWLRCLEPLFPPLKTKPERAGGGGGEMAALGQTSCLQAASDKRPACLLHIHIHMTVAEYATDTWQGPSLPS